MLQAGRDSSHIREDPLECRNDSGPVLSFHFTIHVILAIVDLNRRPFYSTPQPRDLYNNKVRMTCGAVMRRAGSTRCQT